MYRNTFVTMLISGPFMGRFSKSKILQKAEKDPFFEIKKAYISGTYARSNVDNCASPLKTIEQSLRAYRTYAIYRHLVKSSRKGTTFGYCMCKKYNIWYAAG